MQNLGVGTISDATLESNKGVSGGAVAVGTNGTAAVVNALVVKNEATQGGAIYNAGTFSSTNATIASNSATEQGGGLWNGGAATLYNVLAVENAAAEGADVYAESYEVQTDEGETETVVAEPYAYCSISGYEFAYGSNNEIYDASAQMFEDLESGDYRLVVRSQAVDKGNDFYAAVAGLTETSVDIYGDPRFAATAIDVGAAEWIPVPIAAPEFVATSSTASTITVEWTAVDDAVAYELICGQETFQVAGSETTYTFEGLEPETTYQIYLRAVADPTLAADSDYVQTSVATTAFVVLDAPEFTGSKSKLDSVSVFWTAVENATGYRLAYAREGATETTTVEFAADDELAFTVEGLQMSETYQFQVQALGNGVEYADSEYSEILTVSAAGEDQILPAPVVSIASTTTSVTATWDAVENAIGYEIVYGDDTIELSAQETSYVFDGLSYATAVEFSIRTVADEDAFFSSDFVDVEAATDDLTDLPVPTISNVALTVDSISIEWDAVENAVNYTVAYAPAGETNFETVDVDGTSFALNELEYGASWVVKVRANGDEIVYRTSEYSEDLVLTASTYLA
ncbi:MAG: fibronectin type III domain-containing protein, partial [Thermoguttaceae bacterium]|nr:fibronectin type III domain-containing protein [Thermoguttaceae bacterium]